MTDRITAAARRALDSLNDLIRDSTDPGTEALAARFDLEQALLTVGEQPPADAKQQLTTAIYDALTGFQRTAHLSSLQHAQMRQYLAEHLADALALRMGVQPTPETVRTTTLTEAAAVAESLRQFERTTGPRATAQVSENVGILRVAEELRRRAAVEVAHVVADDSSNPEHVDDCPGCQPAPVRP